MCEKVLGEVYARNCDCLFLGEAERSPDGKVYCPQCEVEWDTESPFTETIKVWKEA